MAEITIIPAKNRTDEIIRAAAYARVSSDSEDQLNYFAAQIRYYTELLSGSTDMVFVDMYAEVCLSNIPIIVEEKLTWKQVMEIRRDIASIEKIHRFRKWVDSELEGKEKGEIIQSFEKALDDYKYALKKHGIMTIVGGLTTILSASSTAVEAISGDFSTQISAGLAISGGLITYTATQLSDFFEKKREPIALIYDLEKKFVKRRKNKKQD